MNTVLSFENEELSCLSNTRMLEKVRQSCPDDLVILVSAGDFSSGGSLLTPFCEERAKAYVKAGADLVLSLPVASVLGGYGKKEFAGAALAQNLHAPDFRIVIPCVPAAGQTLKDCEKKLRSFAMLMFQERSGYRSTLTKHLTEMPLREAQAQTVCECFPEAAEFLFCPENRQALWLLDAMLQLYYMPKTQFIAVEKGEAFVEDRGHTIPFENNAAAKAAAFLESCSPEQLIDISGSTTQMVERLLEKKADVLSAGSLKEIADLLKPAPEDRSRLFLLKMILGIRKIQMQICGLHTYVPYCHVCACNPDRLDQLKQLEEISWIPFIGGQLKAQKAKEDYSYLLEADRKAGELTTAQ